MSMNFAREQSLLRQRLQAAGNAAAAEQQKLELGSAAAFLGAGKDAIDAAAQALVAAYPAMGRAQMTAFVRTLWQSKIHELRAVGIELLAARATLLEPADLAFLEGLLKDCDADPLAARLAGDVVGAVVTRHKKLWKDLRRLAAASQDVLRLAAVRASRLPLLDDAASFPRFAELAEPLVAVADARLQQALDELLAAAAAVHLDAVRAFAEKHGRKVALPKAPRTAAKAPAEPAAVVAPRQPQVTKSTTKKATGRAVPAKAAAAKSAPKKRAAAKKS
jgi:hypothetical protein